GLRRGVLELLTDDPNTPIIRQPFVGTGLVDGNLHLGNDFVAVEVSEDPVNHSLSEQGAGGTPVLRTGSDAAGHWELFLPANRLVQVVTFDPVSGLVAHGFAVTNSAGQRTEFNIGEFQANVIPDTDGDGLPDDIEFAIGTDPHKVDTDGDGISDFAA